MRNILVNALPAGATLLVHINPPIGLDEVPYVFTAMGPGSVVIRVVDDVQVSLRNPLGHSSPFVFFVGPRLGALPTEWLKTALRMFGGFR